MGKTRIVKDVGRKVTPNNFLSRRNWALYTPSTPGRFVLRIP